VCRKAMNCVVHTTSRAMPAQSVFGRDACWMPHSTQIGNSSKNARRGSSFKTTSVKTLNGLHKCAQIVHLSGERTALRDLEPNLSQTLHQFLIISKLTIFICKQFKGPAAFGAVQHSHCHLLHHDFVFGIHLYLGQTVLLQNVTSSI